MADTRAQGIGMTSARTRERLVRRLADHGIDEPDVLERIRNVPRHLFVDEALASRAYEDSALPIGHGQTISQPFVVALMTQAIVAGDDVPRRPAKVLEIGTGCGYQTAVLAPLVDQLFTIERIGSLLRQAKTRLRELAIGNVRFRHGDGMEGWPGQAPFDGILAAAAPERVPDRLLRQLAVGGRLVIPIGPPGQQELVCITRTETDYEHERLCGVSFVPLLGGHWLMRLFSALYDRALTWSAHRHAPAYLGALSFAESSFFPVPPDVMLAPMVLARPARAMYLAALTTITSVLGGLAGYLIGWFAIDAVMPLLERFGYVEAFQRAEAWFGDWGFWAILIAGFSPIPYKVFTIAAGSLAMPLLPFTAASIVGRGARFFLVAWLVAWGGPKVEARLKQYIDIIGWVLVIVVVGLYFLLRH